MVKIVDKGVTTRFYAVEGKTLKDILADLRKKAPKNKNSNAGAVTKYDVGYTYAVGHTETASKKAGLFDSVFFFTEVTATIANTTLLPKLKSDKDLSAKAKAEWKRFAAKLAGHESGHVSLTLATARTLCAEQQKQRATASGPTEKAAADAAFKLFNTAHKKAWSEATLTAKMDAVHKTFDGKNTPAATLDIRIT